MIDAKKPLSDFAWANKRLAWQRQLTFTAGTILVALNLSPTIAFVCYSACQLAEFFEMRLCQRVLDSKRCDTYQVEEVVAKLTMSGTLGAAAIVFYVSIVAIAEGPSIHIGPLFFLLMASLYTAMNSCQLPRVMVARLLVFSIGFVFIPINDLIVVWPQQISNLWTQLGTSLFVLFFVVECARKFASHYQVVQSKMDELRVERDRLTEAFEVQSQFVSITSHELRTPLTSIKGSLDLINDNGACITLNDARRIAEIGQKSCSRLAALIDDLLDFQSLNTGGMVFQFRCIDLRDLVREAIQANRALGQPNGVALEVCLPDTPVYVNGDNDRLLQVMANVLSNAVKFSHRGATVEITVELDGNKGRVSVRDHGIGIPEQARDLVFAPFAQVDGSDKRAFGGTGLGMSISRRIMEDHRGTIDFRSEQGKGTVFIIEMDLMETAASEVVEAEDSIVFPLSELQMASAD